MTERSGVWSGAKKVTFVSDKERLNDESAVYSADDFFWMEKDDIPPKMAASLQNLANQVKEKETKV